MKENSIEEDIKIVEQIKDIFLHLKFHGWINDIKQDIDTDKAIRALEHILSDYKRVLKENEELKADNYELNNRINDLLENILVKKIKDKVEELEKRKQEYKEENTIDEDYFFDINGYNSAIFVLQGLLESED